jgi:PEGA domain/PDZ domain
MRSIAHSALFLLSFCIGTSIVSAQVSASSHIVPGSRVVIAPMDGFETYFAAAVREKKVPISLTLDRDSAQYFIVSTETEWRGFVYGSAAGASWSNGSGSYASTSHASSTRGLEASIMIIDAKSKDIVWAYEVHKSSHGALALGTLAARGKQSVAEACAKHLKEFIEKDESGKGNASSSVVITPIAHNPADQTSPSSPTRTPTLPSQSQPSVLSTVSLSSTPAGADILVDDEFAGNTPSTINIPAGKHIVTVRKSGYQDWVRSMNFYTGSITLSAELNRGAAEPAVVASNPAVAVAPADKLPATDPAPASSSPWIGVAAQSNSDGVLVTAVETSGPAAAVGIQAGDTILALDGRLMKGRSIDSAIASLKPGSRIVINYVHAGAVGEATLTVGTKLM